MAKSASTTGTSGGRRSFLKRAGLAGSAATMGAFPELMPRRAEAREVREETLQAPTPAEAPKHRIRFGVCGMSHDHIYGMSAAIQRGGGELVVAWGDEEDKIAAFKQQYPTRLTFAYSPVKYEKPFLVRSMWHDGQFTYVKSDATELPALYELKDGKPSVVNFQVHNGTYVVPKVIERGYLSLGNERLSFAQQER